MYEFSNKEEYELIPEGDYEVILDSAEIKVPEGNGKRYINCKFLIRTDVEQPQKGRVVFDKIFENKDTNQFDHRKLQKMLLVQGPSGTYTFAGDEELVQFINGLLMNIHISKKEADEYHENPYNEVRYCSYKPSKAQPKSLSNPTANSAEALKNAGIEFNLPSDELPF